ncbi:hypothetical protein [Sporohalobacter salinus]|uniref:hypothetical protein n=1 Tax=Sporohalobacter salinus TaxID=1494606 RepID=UPI001961B7F9|nr:hypothetical protein [Sporohalobacter salinus]MBM7624777.1 hypothetical protein [Sporohalobacter salinus]
MNAYKHDLGQKITTDVGSIAVDRGFVAHLNFETPVAQSITAVLGATALTTETQTITDGITDPDIPRNIRIKGSASGMTGDVVINGTNINDDAISETLALNGTTEVQGDKAFKTITSVELPVQTNSGDEVSVGTANKLGLPYKLSLNTVFKAYRDGTLEGTAPSVAVDFANIENNTVLLDSALNGTNIDVYLIV